MKDKEIENSETIELEAKGEKKPTQRFRAWFLVFVFAIGGFVFYQFSLRPSPQLTEENPIQEQLEEKNLNQEQLEEKKASILDILFSEGPKVGNLAPNFVAEDVYGNKISLSDFQNKKPVLLVFWATWCGYCAKELPDLEAFTRDHQNEIQVIAVSSGESKETIKNYVQEKNINFVMLLDKEKEIWNQYLVRGTPSHFLISSQGKIVSFRPGLASREDFEIMMTMLTELW